MNISAIADAVASHSPYDLLKLLATASPLALVAVVTLAVVALVVSRLR